jgi:hypothetical protein
VVGHHQTDPCDQGAETAGVGVAAGSVAIGGLAVEKQSGRAEPGGRQAASRHGITAVGTLELFSAEADAQFCPLAISTVDPLRLVRWNEPLARRWRLNPRPGDAAHRFMESTWFDHYRESGIGARQRNVLLSYDETRVGRTTRFAKILTMPCPLHEFIILRIQPISRRKYQEAPFAMRVTAIGGERRA